MNSKTILIISYQIQQITRKSNSKFLLINQKPNNNIYNFDIAVGHKPQANNMEQTNELTYFVQSSIRISVVVCISKAVIVNLCIPRSHSILPQSMLKRNWLKIWITFRPTVAAIKRMGVAVAVVAIRCGISSALSIKSRFKWVRLKHSTAALYLWNCNKPVVKSLRMFINNKALASSVMLRGQSSPVDGCSPIVAWKQLFNALPTMVAKCSGAVVGCASVAVVTLPSLRSSATHDTWRSRYPSSTRKIMFSSRIAANASCVVLGQASCVGRIVCKTIFSLHSLYSI